MPDVFYQNAPAIIVLILFYCLIEINMICFEEPFRCHFASCAACLSRSIQCFPRGIRTVIERISAQRTSALVTAGKPLEQTTRVEQILAGLAALIRHLLV